MAGERTVLLPFVKYPHRVLIAVTGISTALHIVMFLTVKSIPKPDEKLPSIVTIKVAEPKPPEPVAKAKKLPPKPKKKTPPKRQQLRGSKKKKPNQPPVKKIQGLSKDSLVKDSSVSAPAGNTLMTKDKGERLSPDQIQALEKNLSSDAILIQGSFEVPEYTQAALDADAEGQFIVDVFVNEKGQVVEAELRKKVGFGMDSRILSSARSSRFIPRKNAKGVPIEGWAEIKFYLQIP